MKKITLYQKDTKDKIREWSIEVVDKGTSADIVVYAGIKDGKLIETVTPITEGLNIGKVNETTYFEQAVLDAKSVLAKQIKKGYVADINNIKSKEETATIKKPMKGEKYHPKGKDDAFTLDDFIDKKAGIILRGLIAGIQRKLDGFRYRIKVNRTEVVFYSSSGDIVPSFPHIASQVLKSFLKIADYVEEKYGITEYYLDGEIYNHDLGFQAVQSACGTKVHLTPEKINLRAQMDFYLFDVCLNAPYTTREKVLKYFYSEDVLQVETYIVQLQEDVIESYFEQFLKEGYEGLMIRLLDMPYEFKRSKQLLKYKPLIDKEFQVVGFKKSITGDTLGSLDLILEDGRVFNATLKNEIGDQKTKKQIWDDQINYLGLWVTVEFLEYTNDGIPRHPRAKTFRKGPSMD